MLVFGVISGILYLLVYIFFLLGVECMVVVVIGFVLEGMLGIV